MEELFTGHTEHPRTRFGDYRWHKARVPRDPEVGGSKRSKVYWGNRVEKIAGMEDPKEIAGNKTTHRVPADRESSHCASFRRKLVDFFIDLCIVTA